MSADIKVPMVRPRSWYEIGQLAERLIQLSCPELIENPGPFPLADFIEFQMKEAMKFEYEISELPEEIEAAMDPKNRRIILSPETYESLLADVPRARFTAAHEIGHALLHSRELQHRILDGGNVLKLNRGSIPAYRDPECQANAFASAFLMPTPHVVEIIEKPHSKIKIMQIFNVSLEAAGYRVKGIDKYRNG
jgi:hypothetical protein